MLAYVRKFTYLSAALNSNNEYLTYSKGKHKIWDNHSFQRNLLRKQGFLCTFTWQSHQRHSWRSQFYLQRLPVGRDNVSHVWRVPLWRWLRGRCQQKRVPPARITWSPDTDEPHNRTCHKGTLPWRHGIQVFVRQCVQIQHHPKAQWPSDETQHEDGDVQIRPDCQRGFRPCFRQDLVC